jgi:MoxR-like ATPase
VSEHAAWFESPARTGERLAAVGYLSDTATGTTTYLAGALGKPLLVEGPAGVGKTELAKAVSRATGAELVRLQCYEGLDEARALYEWNYKKQLLRIQAAGDQAWDQTHDDVFTDEFLLTRPLLTAIRREEPTVLLVDEVDKTDVEVEGLLLGILSDFQVTIPELRTSRSSRWSSAATSPSSPTSSAPSPDPLSRGFRPREPRVLTMSSGETRGSTGRKARFNGSKPAAQLAR